MGINCKVVKDFKRPSEELMEKFRGLPVANIDDCMGRLAAVDPAIKPVGYKGQLIGPALTVKVAQGDNLMYYVGMELAKPGDVIVIDAGGFEDRAILGELMSGFCKMRGVRGIIVDGAIRDYNPLAEMENFQVYARSATPDGPYKNGPGEVNTPVIIGGRICRPGDIVVADYDGIVFVRPEEAEALAAAAKAVQIKENGIADAIEVDAWDRSWVDQKLEEIGCEFVDFAE